MYEGEAFSRQMNRQERNRKRKKRRMWKRIFAGILTVALIGTSIVLTDRLLSVKVFAAPEQETEFLQTVVLSTFAEEIVSENLLSSKQEIIEEKSGVPVVILDPGHGGEDEGCARDGVREKDINLSIAKLVRDKLEALGYQVLMVRDMDTYISKEDRVIYANQSQGDIYVSIHQNASDDISVSGMEIWYEGEDGSRDNERLAQLIQQQILENTGAAERELRGNADFHVTGKTTMPACLIETGFLSNAEERKNLTTGEYQEKIAEGIAQGIELYFHPKTMYLTFDDGPSEENTNRVLDILQKRNIKATFFW